MNEAERRIAFDYLERILVVLGEIREKLNGPAVGAGGIAGRGRCPCGCGQQSSWQEQGPQ